MTCEGITRACRSVQCWNMRGALSCSQSSAMSHDAIRYMQCRKRSYFRNITYNIARNVARCVQCLGGHRTGFTVMRKIKFAWARKVCFDFASSTQKCKNSGQYQKSAATWPYMFNMFQYTYLQSLLLSGARQTLDSWRWSFRHLETSLTELPREAWLF